jgi:hypothetical protein
MDTHSVSKQGNARIASGECFDIKQGWWGGGGVAGRQRIQRINAVQS